MDVAVDDGLTSSGAPRPALSCRHLHSAESSIAERRVAIVIVNWNGWKDTIECLDSLLAQDYRNHLIVVVDNDSRDGSVDRIAEWCERPYRSVGWNNIDGVRRVSDCARPKSISYRIGEAGSRLTRPGECQVFIVHSGGNLGFAGGCNIGAEYVCECDCDYVWLLNSDTIVHHSSLIELVHRASEKSGQGFTGSTLLYYRRPKIVQALGGADLSIPNCVIRHRGEGIEHVVAVPEDSPEPSLTYIVGASMLVPISLVETIGMMQDDYFLYYEEIDWAYRSRGRYRQSHASRSLIYHKAGASSKDKVSEFSKRLLFSNKLLFFSRYISYLNSRLRYEMLKELVRDVLRGRWRVAKVLVQIVGKRGSGPEGNILVGR